MSKNEEPELWEKILFIIAIPFIGLLYLIWWILGGDTKFLDETLDKPKQLFAIMLLSYGMVALLITNYFGLLPPLYLPPNLAIVAAFLGIGVPIIFVCCIVIYVHSKKKSGSKGDWSIGITHEEHRHKSGELRKRPKYGRKVKAYSVYAEVNKAWESEDQSKQLDEQLSLGHFTQEEYEQKKKSLEKSKK